MHVCLACTQNYAGMYVCMLACMHAHMFVFKYVCYVCMYVYNCILYKRVSICYIVCMHAYNVCMYVRVVQKTQLQDRDQDTTKVCSIYLLYYYLKKINLLFYV